MQVRACPGESTTAMAHSDWNWDCSQYHAQRLASVTTVASGEWLYPCRPRRIQPLPTIALRKSRHAEDRPNSRKILTTAQTGWLDCRVEAVESIHRERNATLCTDHFDVMSINAAVLKTRMPRSPRRSIPRFTDGPFVIALIVAALSIDVANFQAG